MTTEKQRHFNVSVCTRGLLEHASTPELNKIGSLKTSNKNTADSCSLYFEDVDPCQRRHFEFTVCIRDRRHNRGFDCPVKQTF